MHQAIPYRTTWTPASAAGTSTTTATEAMARPATVRKLVLENAIIVFGRRGCCMCHVAKQLLLGHGVNPAVYEVEEEDEVGVVEELSKMSGGRDGITIMDYKPQFPVVFVGGKMFGGLERIIACHISGELVPILKAAGALWL